jgi:hypothetical protein
MSSPDVFGTPLPSERDYEKSVEMAAREEHIYSDTNMLKAIARHAPDQNFKRFLHASKRAAMILEPVDRSTGLYVDDTMEATRSATFGAVFGGFVVARVHGDAIALNRLSLPFPEAALEDVADDAERRHVQAVAVSDYAGQGIKLTGNIAEKLVEEIEERVISDVTKQRYFRLGFGAVIHAAWNSHIANNYAMREAALAKLDAGSLDIDWDGALNDLQ